MWSISSKENAEVVSRNNTERTPPKDIFNKTIKIQDTEHSMTSFIGYSKNKHRSKIEV